VAGLSEPCTLGYGGRENYYPYIPQLFVTVAADLEPLEDLVVQCSLSSPAIQSTLQDNVRSERIDIDARSEALFQVELNQSATVTCETSASSISVGELDLVVESDYKPSRTALFFANCTSETSSSNETCVVDVVVESGDTRMLYVMLTSYDGPVNGASVICTIETEEPPNLISSLLDLFTSILDTFMSASAFLYSGKRRNTEWG